MPPAAVETGEENKSSRVTAGIADRRSGGETAAGRALRRGGGGGGGRRAGISNSQ